MKSTGRQKAVQRSFAAFLFIKKIISKIRQRISCKNTVVCYIYIMSASVLVNIPTDLSESTPIAPQVEARTDPLRQQDYKSALHFVKYLTANFSLFSIFSVFYYNLTCRYDHSPHINPQERLSTSKCLSAKRKKRNFIPFLYKRMRRHDRIKERC